MPEESAEDTYQKMSPRYVTMYKKNNEVIPQINHETLDLGAYRNIGFISLNQQQKKKIKLYNRDINKIYDYLI